MMPSTINSLRVKGEPVPKNLGHIAPLSTTLRANRPQTNPINIDRSYQFVLKEADNSSELLNACLPHHSVPMRKMEHLSRVRTANFGISTMDSPFMANGDREPFIIDKPHFVLCGLPVGSKDIDHHLYVSEARVGNFKTSAKALYQARRGMASGKAYSEPVILYDKDARNHASPEGLENVGPHAVPQMPPMPPTTPTSYVDKSTSTNTKTKTVPVARQYFELQGGAASFHGTIPNSTEWEHCTPMDLLVKHKKVTLQKRELDALELHREQSSISTRSVRSMETVKDSVVNNSMTVTTGKRSKLAQRPSIKTVVKKVNYNNPYRNTKYRERMALSSGGARLEFNSVDSYVRYQRQQAKNGKQLMTPRTVLRVPNPCSDTFLLQMMYDLNRPKSRRSRVPSAKYSDIANTRDLEDFVYSRTSSSLSKTQSNIDRFLGRRSDKGAKSAKSGKSGADADTIEEESIFDATDDRSSEDKGFSGSTSAS